jgi:uncharacterized protein (DUF427 family)
MKAVVDGTVVAEAPTADTVQVEGNAYFPPTSLKAGALRDSSTPYTCPWKGKAQYHDVLIDDTVLRDAAWSYPGLLASAVDRVGRDFAGYVAFDTRQVRIED